MRDWKPRFLEVLSQGSTVTTAAAAAGIHRSNANRARKSDAEFSAAWDEAIESGTDVLEERAIKRAMEYSDVLLLALLKSRRPEKFMERQRLEHVRVDLSSAQLELEQMAARILQENEEDKEQEPRKLPCP